MDALTADFLTNLTAELAAPVITKVSRRFQQAWQGDASEQALRRCVQAGIYGMVSRASLDTPDDEALLADIFTTFFDSGDVANEVVKLIRLQSLDVDELRFQFAEAGYDAETLPGLQFPAAIAAFEAAFLEQTTNEDILQPIIQVQQGWAQTALQREMVALMRQMNAALQMQTGQTIDIRAGRIEADNVVGGNQHIDTQIIYQWDGGSGLQSGEEDYLKKLIGRCNRLDLADVDELFFTDDENEVHLTDVFTTLYAARNGQIITRTPEQTVKEALQKPREDEMLAGGRQQKDKEEERLPIPAVAVAGVLPRLVILGHPGGGKSSIVNYLATALARQRLTTTATPLPEWPDSPSLPVRIILRRFAAWLIDTIGDDVPAAKEGLVWRYLEQKLLTDWGCTETYQHIKQTLQNEGGVIFFDGLDEVPESVDDERRTLIKETIVDFARPLTQCKIIITCREYAYKEKDKWRLPAAQFPTIDLALFGKGQIQQFTQTWYQMMGPRQQWSVEKQKREATRLADAVIAKPHLFELGKYPLLLTLMAQVHGRYGDLPENRADLYDRAVDLLLSHWENRLVRGEDGKRQIEPGLIARLGLQREEVRSVLQAIAFAAHERQEGQQERDGETADISRDELWEGLRPLVGGSYDGAEEITDYIQQRSGLLQARERHTYAFPHRTFQEFLAAAHVWSLPVADPVEALYKRLERDTTWWREIFLLAAGQERTSASRVMGLVNRLVAVEPASAAVTEWAFVRVLLAAQTIYETNFMRFVRGKADDHPYVLLVARVRAWLETALVAESSLPPIKRAEAGRALGGWLEDTREGVGVEPETRLPDIRWGEEVSWGLYELGGDGGAYRSFDTQEVEIEQTFKLSRYPITNVQFQCFIDAQERAEDADKQTWWNGIPSKEQNFDEPAFPYANHPCERVSWYQAVAFCRWLSDKRGEEITLPNEYQWEVAARWGGERTDHRFYPWGDDFDENKANIGSGNHDGQTTAVGIYPSGRNRVLNLYDMSGNVWEWCSNKYSRPDDADIDDSNEKRVLRGGSWYLNRRRARAASRSSNHPANRYDFVGFRVVCVRSPSYPEIAEPQGRLSDITDLAGEW